MSDHESEHRTVPEEPIPEGGASPEGEMLVGRRPRPLRVLVRFAVGVGVVAFLLAQSDLGEIVGVVRDVRPGLALAALAALLTGLVAGAFRWQAFLRPLGLALHRGPLLRLSFVGMFFNAFLPTGVGGDAYKAIRLRRGPGSLAPAFASVLLDRIAGLVLLALVGLGGVAVRAWQGEPPSVETGAGGVLALAAVLGVACLVGIVVVIAAGERLFGPFGQTPLRIAWKLRRMMATIAAAGRDARAFWWALAAGAVFQGMLVTAHVLLASALGLGIPAAAMAAVVLIAMLATLVPVTINGLGFREGVYVWALGAYGVGHDPALAFALLVLLLLLAASAIGGIVYVSAGGDLGRGSFRRAGPS